MNDKGRRFETSIKHHLANRGIGRRIHAEAKGIPGPDLIVEEPAAGLYDWAVECKNQRRLDLAGWWRQTESQADESSIPVLVHKRHGTTKPGDQWVTLTLDTLVRLIDRE